MPPMATRCGVPLPKTASFPQRALPMACCILVPMITNSMPLTPLDVAAHRVRHSGRLLQGMPSTPLQSSPTVSSTSVPTTATSTHLTCLEHDRPERFSEAEH